MSSLCVAELFVMLGSAELSVTEAVLIACDGVFDDFDRNGRTG